MSSDGVASASTLAAPELLDLAPVNRDTAQLNHKPSISEESCVQLGPFDHVLRAGQHQAAQGWRRRRVPSGDRRSAYVSLLSPLIVAGVVVLGLASLCLENLSGSVGARQLNNDHATAIQKILFRP
jgi:hypothetical protein